MNWNRFLRSTQPYLLVGVLTILVGLGASALREVCDQSYDRRIYFFYGQGIYYILAREYQSHWLIEDRLVIQTTSGPIELEAHGNERTLQKIAELERKGAIHEGGPR